MAVAACSGGASRGHVDTYTAGATDRELVVRFVTGPQDDATVTIKRQDSKTITVELQITGPDAKKGDLSNSLGQQRHATLRLDQPLGSRAVRNVDGTDVERVDALTN